MKLNDKFHEPMEGLGGSGGGFWLLAAERVARPYHPPRRIPNLLALTSSLRALTSSLRAFFNWLRAIFNESAGSFNWSAGSCNWLAAFGDLHSQLRDVWSQWCERRDFLGLPWESSFGCWKVWMAVSGFGGRAGRSALPSAAARLCSPLGERGSPVAAANLQRPF